MTRPANSSSWHGVRLKSRSLLAERAPNPRFDRLAAVHGRASHSHIILFRQAMIVGSFIPDWPAPAVNRTRTSRGTDGAHARGFAHQAGLTALGTELTKLGWWMRHTRTTFVANVSAGPRRPASIMCRSMMSPAATRPEPGRIASSNVYSGQAVLFRSWPRALSRVSGPTSVSISFRRVLIALTLV